jgi:hypothetical protein
VAEVQTSWYVVNVPLPEKLTCYTCDPKRVDRKEKSEQAEDVTTCHFECGHTCKLFVRTLVEKITLSDSLESCLIINPVPEVEDALKKGDHFRAVALLHAVLEYYGKLPIDKRLESEKRSIDWNKIERLHLFQVALFVYALGIVSQSCYTALIQLNKFRNDLLHIKMQPSFAGNREQKQMLRSETH